MRIYQIADELNVSSQDVLDVLNNDLGLDVNHHMESVDQQTIRRVKVVFQDNTPDPDMLLSGPSRLKNLYGSAVDSLAFGIGLGLLLTPKRGQETRETLREEITELGQEITDPLKVAGEEIIELASILPTQLSGLTDSAVEYGSDQVNELSPLLQGAVEEAVDFFDSSRFSLNGKNKTESTQDVR